MTDEFRVVYQAGLTEQLERWSQTAERDPGSREAKLLVAGLDGIDAVKDGKEAEHRGERLGCSPHHYDLRDCAEIKVEVFDERNRAGKKRGPSHRLIYREFDADGEDPRPIREIVAFERRRGGQAFEVAAQRLGRDKGVEDPTLSHLPNTVPAVGRNKKPDRPVSPPRMPLTPEIAAALSTAQKAKPTRPKSTPPRTTVSRAGPQRQVRGRSR